MRSTPIVVALVVWAGLGLASAGTAQTVTGPTIHNVTLHESAGVLTITGTGFGSELRVTVDGQPVTVMQGGTETKIDVLAPAALLTTPGTYRLTVVDPMRKVGDAFVVASRAGDVVPGGVTPSAPVPVIGPAAATVGTPVAEAVVISSSNGSAPLFIEDSGSPYRTALGYQALFNNTNSYNTALGYQSLFSNTAGYANTASGFWTLMSNTTGQYNTASGYQALRQTTGNYNTAFGAHAGWEATTGSWNLFLGADVLGTAADTNTIGIGRPYWGGGGQNKTFIAGIRDTALTGSVVPVYIDANGQLGTVPPPSPPGVIIPGAPPMSSSLGIQDETVERQLADQQATIADLRDRLAPLEALLAPGAAGK